MRKLKQDNLGAKGESRFWELCEDEGLICNKSLRDRAGWDYIVDFEQDETGVALLDRRKPPLSCVVQVKTIMDSTKRIEVKLNMAERLAKEPKPAFFVIFRVDEKKNFTSLHVIHVMGECLASILKRLRYEESQSNRDGIHKKKVTFKVADENEIFFSGASLREAFTRYAGDDLHGYISEKKKQVASLGYEMHAFDGNMVLNAPDVEKLMDIFLGEEKNAEVGSFESFEIRFGIRLPHIALTSGKITITPHPSGRCKIKLKNCNWEYPIVLSGDIYHTPPIIANRRKTLFKTALLKITVDHSAKGVQIQLTQDSILEGTIEQWLDFYTVRWMMSSAESTVDVIAESFGKILGFSLSDVLSNKTINIAAPLTDSKSLALLYKVQRLAGADTGKVYLGEHLSAAHEGLRMIYALSSNEGLAYEGEEITNHLQKLPGTQAYIINKIVLGETVFGYYGVAAIRLEKGTHEAKIILSSFRPEGAEVLSNGADDFERFKDSVNRENSDRIIFSAQS